MREDVADFSAKYEDSPKAVAFRNFVKMSSVVGVLYKEALKQWTHAKKFNRLPRLYRKRKRRYDQHCRKLSQVTFVGFGVPKETKQDPAVDRHDGGDLDEEEPGNLKDSYAQQFDCVRTALRAMDFTELMIERSIARLRDAFQFRNRFVHGAVQEIQ